MPKCIVIGGGFGGIAAALRMRKKGYEVTLIDKQDKLGGRAYAYEKHTEHGTFKHDAGPTVITARFLFDELFELFGKKREDYVEFRDIYPWYRIVFAGESATQRAATVRERNLANPDAAPSEPRSAPQADNADDRPADGSSAPSRSRLVAVDLPHFDYGGTLEQFEAQIRKFGGEEDVVGFRKYLAHSKKIFDVGFTKLGDQPFDKFTTMLKCAPDLLRLGCYRTVWQMGKKYIKNPLLRRVFSFQPLLVGGNPFNTTSIYSLIFYLERQWGVQFAIGGTGAIVRALEKLMEEEGIEVRLNTSVKRLITTGRHFRQNGYRSIFEFRREALAVELQDGEVLHAAPYIEDEEHGTLYDFDESMKSPGIIVCNGDPPAIYRSLIDAQDRPTWSNKKIDALKYSMGLFVFYFGTTRQYPGVAHHTIVLGEAYRELLEKLFDKHELEREDLSVYLHRPTATDPSMAPAGMDSFYVLVPVPNLEPVLQRAATVRERSNPAYADAATSEPRSANLAGNVDERPADGDPAPSRSRLVTEPPLTADGFIDWDNFGDTFRDDVIAYLERTVLPGLSECITGDFYVTPNHFRDNLNTHHGTGFSIQPIFRQSAWFRFHNKSEDIDGLYFVGAGTHPGAGMPGVLCSAKVVDNLIPPVSKSDA